MRKPKVESKVIKFTVEVEITANEYNELKRADVPTDEIEDEVAGVISALAAYEGADVLARFKK